MQLCTVHLCNCAQLTLHQQVSEMGRVSATSVSFLLLRILGTQFSGVALVPDLMPMRQCVSLASGRVSKASLSQRTSFIAPAVVTSCYWLCLVWRRLTLCRSRLVASCRAVHVRSFVLVTRPPDGLSLSLPACRFAVVTVAVVSATDEVTCRVTSTPGGLLSAGRIFWCGCRPRQGEISSLYETVHVCPVFYYACHFVLQGGLLCS